MLATGNLVTLDMLLGHLRYKVRFSIVGAAGYLLRSQPEFHVAQASIKHAFVAATAGSIDRFRQIRQILGNCAAT